MPVRKVSLAAPLAPPCPAWPGAWGAAALPPGSIEATSSNCAGWPSASKLSFESKIGSR